MAPFGAGEVFDVLGRVIQNKKSNPLTKQFNFEIDLSKNANGTYVFRLISQKNNIRWAGKIIKTE